MFFFLFTKRLLKKPSFAVILLMMPVLVFAFKLVLKEDSSSIHIAIYSYDNNPLMEESIKVMTERKDQMSFYVAESEEELKRAVLTNEAECGFVVAEGFMDALIDEHAEEMITIYKNTKTTLDDLTKEMFFAAIFEKADYQRMLKHMKQKGFEELAGDDFDYEAANKFMRERYEQYLQDGGIFEVIYENNGKTKESSSEEVTSGEYYLMRPIRGILALFMMIAAMAGAVFRAIDEKQGVYKTLGYEERPYINLLTVFIPTLMAGIVAMASLYIGGTAEAGASGFFTELAGLVAYIILLTGFANLLRCFIKNEAMLASILPMLTVVSLLGCNIFFNIASMVDGIRQLRYVLPPNYFLEHALSLSDQALTIGIGLVLIVLGIIKDRRNI